MSVDTHANTNQQVRSFVISVIVPAYNSERTLGICLRSLVQQSIPRDQYEIIVVDDGSVDGTAALAESFGVRVVRHNAVAARQYIENMRLSGIRQTQNCDLLHEISLLVCLLLHATAPSRAIVRSHAGRTTNQSPSKRLGG